MHGGHLNSVERMVSQVKCKVKILSKVGHIDDAWGKDLTLAITLVRPLPLFEANDSKYEFTTERYGSVKRVFVVTERDLMATKKFQLWMIENNLPDITVVVKGADHMVMASKPFDPAYQLQRIAQQLSLFDF
ncbi:unnamed protein product [Citrullus colocynthis]|uniref:Uncharacterized protein n=1 Tax=Citrullus colocynthis TaxID=252529 RepID=A0ABP0Z751_9ROSI